MEPTCFRCGSCCKNYFCLVPKYKDSNLSEEFLSKYADEHGYEEMQKYIADNTIPQGEKCIWLTEDETGICTCTAYMRRAEMCVNHNHDNWCNIGLSTWHRRYKQGNKIPEEIMVLLKQHPWYKKIFEE